MSNGHGGKRNGAGRPPKKQSEKMIEMLNKHVDEDKAFQTLNDLIAEGNLRAVQIFLDRKYGQPTTHSVQDIAVQNLEMPNIVWKSTAEMDKEYEQKMKDNE
jgi:hypothetical protein